MLLRSGADRSASDPELELGAFLATIILTLLRGLFEWMEATGKLRSFLVGFLWKGLPGILKFALKYQDIYLKLLKALWVWIGDILADAKPE